MGLPNNDRVESATVNQTESYDLLPSPQHCPPVLPDYATDPSPGYCARHSSVREGLIVAAVVLVVMFGLLANICTLERQRVERALKLAPQVQMFALAHFHEIDLDHDGIIVDAEMSAATKHFTGEETELLRFMRQMGSVAGHEIGVVESRHQMTVVFGKIVAQIPQTEKVTQYGFSREDLESFSDRVTMHFKQ